MCIRDRYFSLYNSNAHRAVSAAEICGSIFWNLLEIIEEDQEKARVAMEKNRPSSEEIEVCAVIQNMIAVSYTHLMCIRDRLYVVCER